MKIIKSNSFLIEEKNPLKKVELAGRICYKSESNITDESAVTFYHKMAKSKHYAMLEHGTVTFEIKTYDPEFLPIELISLPFIVWSQKNDNLYYVTVSLSHIEQYKSGMYNNLATLMSESMTNILTMVSILEAMSRLVEANYISKSENSSKYDTVPYYCDIKLLNDVTEIKDFNYNDWLTHKFITFKFICDRGVSHELVRHRCSVAQESTRYCNYSKDKYNNEITFVEPANYGDWCTVGKLIFEAGCSMVEKYYMMLSKLGYKAQQSRALLNNALKTEVILTMPAGRWKHFFNLRSIGTTGAPHPDMKVVADIAIKEFNKLENVFLNNENTMDEGEE